MQRAKLERDIQQEAQRKVHDASARAADRIQQEREYTRRAEEKRCEVQPTSARLSAQHSKQLACTSSSLCTCLRCGLA